jgi:hypothetical protein
MEARVSPPLRDSDSLIANQRRSRVTQDDVLVGYRLQLFGSIDPYSAGTLAGSTAGPGAGPCSFPSSRMATRSPTAAKAIAAVNADA